MWFLVAIFAVPFFIAVVACGAAIWLTLRMRRGWMKVLLGAGLAIISMVAIYVLVLFIAMAVGTNKFDDECQEVMHKRNEIGSTIRVLEDMAPDLGDAAVDMLGEIQRRFELAQDEVRFYC